jgi:hypothetical protein
MLQNARYYINKNRNERKEYLRTRADRPKLNAKNECFDDWFINELNCLTETRDEHLSESVKQAHYKVVEFTETEESFTELAATTIACLDYDLASFFTKVESRFFPLTLDDLSNKIEQSFEDFTRDFWYTRNGHGCGFLAGDYGGLGYALTVIAKSFGQVDTYVYKEALYLYA